MMNTISLPKFFLAALVVGFFGMAYSGAGGANAAGCFMKTNPTHCSKDSECQWEPGGSDGSGAS